MTAQELIDRTEAYYRAKGSKQASMTFFEQAMAEVQAAAKAETERLRQQSERLISVARAITTGYAELRWLEKDYDDQREGDWTR